MAETKIEWTWRPRPDGAFAPGYTWNAWIGCTEAGPECDHCYARHLMQDVYKRARWGKGNPRDRTAQSTWRHPLRWNAEAQAAGERRVVFTNSLADFFDDEVPDSWRQEAFDVVRQCEWLDWLLLTKRSQNLATMVPWSGGGEPWENVWRPTTWWRCRTVRRRTAGRAARSGVPPWSSEPRRVPGLIRAAPDLS